MIADSAGSRPPSVTVPSTTLLGASGAGFTPELRAAADAGEAILLDLARLYRGMWE